MSLALRYAAASDVGLLREENEDSAYAGPRLLAVADGMGGAAAGEVASSVAIARVADLDDDVPGADLLDLLKRTVESANAELSEMVNDNKALEGMGTTLTALLWEGAGQNGRLGLAHVGDSRAYLLRGGELNRITRDHTLVQSLVDEGRLSSEEASTHPQRSLLTNVLDGRAEPELDLSLREARLGDRYLICSDGLPAVVSEETIAEALGQHDPQQAVERLIELALRGGGPDNVTCVVADVVEDAPVETGPVVVGAAATRAPRQRRVTADSAAGRAALARRGAGPDESTTPPAPARPRRRWRRALVFTFALLAVVALAAAGGYAYVRSQYFVGSDDDRVVVYRGLVGSVAGLDLQEVHDETGLEVGDLGEFEQQAVTDGIQATGESDAYAIVERLRSGVCVQPTPSPTPTPRRDRDRARDAERSPAPSPTPTADPGDATDDCPDGAP